MKVLDRQPHTITMIIGKYSNIEAKSSTLTLANEDTIRPDRQASIIYYQSIKLTLQEWNEFEKLLSNCNFWNLTPHKQDSQIDGSTWIIEGHLKNKYWYVAQLSPHGTTFEKAGLYLLEKSGLLSKPIYTQHRNELP